MKIFRARIYQSFDQVRKTNVLMNDVIPSEFTYTTEKDCIIHYTDLNFTDEKSFWEFKQAWDKYLKDSE